MANPTSAPPDPFEVWREWVAQSERNWNGFLNQFMGTDQYTQSMSRLMDAFLGMQRGLGETMGRYLASLNVATRTDVLALGERLASIEEHLARIEGGVRAESALAEPAVPAPVVRPPRTKRPE